MKQATLAAQVHLRRLAAAVGLEGAFLLVGTVLLATGAGYLSPAGPWLVVGGVSLLLGLALAVPVRRTE